MRRRGVPAQVLTDNGKVCTGRFGPGTGEVLFDRICRENGIRHLLTAPRSPTTLGVYGHVPDDLDQAAACRLDALFVGGLNDQTSRRGDLAARGIY